MLTQEEISQFQERGFLKSRRVIDETTVDHLRAELERVIQDREGAGPSPVHIVNLTRDDSAPVWQVVNIWQASEAFRNLMSHPTLLEETAQLSGAKELRIWHDQIQYKPAGHGGVNMWHQDNPLWPIIDPPTQVTAWVALDDVDESNGCMSMVPGSHLWGDQMACLRELTSYDSMPKTWKGHPLEVVRCPVARGEVHYHHCLTWHGSHANTSGRPRRAIAYHYMTGETYYIASGNHVMKPFVQVADGAKLEGPRFPLLWKGE
jgi:phytanoyl-CoA hydroxylase